MKKKGQNLILVHLQFFQYFVISLQMYRQYNNSLSQIYARLIYQAMQAASSHIHEVYNQQVPNTKLPGFTSIYRKKGTTKLITSMEESIFTVRDLINKTKKLYGEKEGIGEIKVAMGKDEAGKQIEKRTIIQHTYNEIFENAYNFGRYVYSKHLFLDEKLMKLKFIGLYSKNRYQWFIVDWAFSLFGITNVPLYDTIGLQNLIYCLQQTQISTLIVSSTTVKLLLQLSDLGNLKTLISFDHLNEQTKASIKAHNLELLDFWGLVKEGSQMADVSNQKIQIGGDDIFTFSYTSGTTGPPKAVIISNTNLLSCAAGYRYHQDFNYNHYDRYLSYLPLPHLMERSVSYYSFYVGANVIISSGNTLKIREDCEVGKITIFVSVPRVFSKIAENIKNKFIEMKLPTFYHPGVFAKVRESFGGCIKFLATGSAPLNVEVRKYLKEVFACPFLEGYGQTQTTAGICFSRSNDQQFAYISELGTSTEVKLCDIPEMKYFSTDLNQKGQPTPRGQLWSRGPAVFIGYYKAPDKTRQTIDQQGWVKSGDVVQMHPLNNSFKIIDRKKNIFKLQQGQYVAPDRIQNTYMKSPLISQAFLHGDTYQPYAVGIFTPNTETFRKLTEEHGIKGTHEQLCGNKEARKLLLTQLNNLGKKEGLHSFELAKNIYLQPKGFIFKGILTNTMKLIRYEARNVYKIQIESLYKEGQLLLK